MDCSAASINRMKGRRALKTAVVMIGVICFMAAQAVAGDFKLGVIDFQKVLSNSSPGKLASAELNEKGKEMEEAIKKQEEELMALKETLEREALVMGKEKSEQKQREFRIKVNDFKTLKNNSVKDFKQIQARYFNRIKTEVLELAAQMGKKEGFDLILEVNEGGVLFFADRVDITDRLIAEYNKSAAKQ